MQDILSLKMRKSGRISYVAYEMGGKQGRLSNSLIQYEGLIGMILGES